MNATKKIAACARIHSAKALITLILPILLAFVVSGCALPDKPIRMSMYDFGPGQLMANTASLAKLPPLAIDDIATPSGSLEGTAVLYRLDYLDAQQLRPYSQARWSSPPAQLVRQRLREHLSQRRSVFNAREGAALNRVQNPVLPLLLRLELEEFSQLFSTPQTSVGLIRMRATLIELTAAGEKLVAQRNLVVQSPATSQDAAGGVRALTAATDAAIVELDQWLQQMPAR